MAREAVMTDVAGDELTIRRYGGVFELEGNGESLYSFTLDSVESLEKLQDELTDFLGEAPSTEPDHVNAEDVSFNEGLIRFAIVHRRVVLFRYGKGDGSHIETRSLIPSSIETIGDHETVTGYDPDRDEPRAYRLDRIKGEVNIRSVSYP